MVYRFQPLIKKSASWEELSCSRKFLAAFLSSTSHIQQNKNSNSWYSIELPSDFRLQLPQPWQPHYWASGPKLGTRVTQLKDSIKQSFNLSLLKVRSKLPAGHFLTLKSALILFLSPVLKEPTLVQVHPWRGAPLQAMKRRMRTIRIPFTSLWDSYSPDFGDVSPKMRSWGAVKRQSSLSLGRQ